MAMTPNTSVDEALAEKVGLEQPNFVSQLLTHAKHLVVASRRMPVGEEHAIRMGSKDFVQNTRELRDEMTAMLHGVLKFVDPAGHQSSSHHDVQKFDLVTDSIDSILERVECFIKDAAMMEAGGSAAQQSVVDSNKLERQPTEVPATAVSSSFAQAAGVRGGEAGDKPQVRWRQLVDNQRTRFVPRLLTKHNQKVALHEDIVEAQRKAGIRHSDDGNLRAAGAPHAPTTALDPALLTHLNSLGVAAGATGADGVAGDLPHPYKEELQTLGWPDHMFAVRPAQLYGKMEDTPLVCVRTASELREMVDEIKATCRGGEVAIDVEHHQYRSYRGFVCLVQVSSRRKDWLIDPFDIFEEMHILNEVCSDPSILKVLHGADRDVQWLQRDFSVYLVNMFDTGQATRVLRLTGGFSLANLVSHMCGVKLDKKYQTADWRERPLSKEMTLYARMDTHYLLYCYDCLRNALLSGSTSCAPSVVGAGEAKATSSGVQNMREVLDRSTALCLTQHSESPFREGDAAMQLFDRFGSKSRPLESRQFAALQAIVGWRDRLARQLDESWNFIAPDACLWRVAVAVPPNLSRLRSSCNPLPPLLQKHAQEVIDLITQPTQTLGDSGTKEIPDWPAAPADGAKGGDGGPASSEAHSNGPGVPGGNRVVQPTPAPAAAAQRKPAASAPVVSLTPWPDRACSDLQPIVHICFTRVAARTNGRQINTATSQRPTLATLFDDMSEAEDEEDEEEQGLVPEVSQRAESFSMVKMKQLRAAMRFAAEAPDPSTAEQPPKTAQETLPAEEVVVVDDVTEGDGAIPMRQAHNLPRPERRKKKKRPAPEDSHVDSQAARLGDLDQEVESFRQALLGAMGAVATGPASVLHPFAVSTAAADEVGPPKKKRKKKVVKNA